MADRIVVIGTGFSETIDVRAEVQAYEIYGRKGNDLIYGSALDDVIVGEEGNDDLFGGAGNDLFLIGLSAGADQIDGGAGYDVIRGDDGDTIIQLRRLTVGQSIEEINGGGGNNTLAGTSASNTLHFWDLTLGSYTETEDFYLPFSTAMALKMGHWGNMDCWARGAGTGSSLDMAWRSAFRSRSRAVAS